MTHKEVMQQALEAHKMLRDWIKAVPQEVALPAMPGIDGDWLDEVESNLRAALEQPEQEPVALTLDSAPLGTKAPAFGGGAWTKTESGWKWNSGSTFPRPGGDWTGRLILPAAQPEHGDIRALKYRIHELEGEVIGYKRMIEEAALKKLADLGQQLEQAPVAWKGLTPDETMLLMNQTAGQHWADEAHIQRFRAALEETLKEKNT